MRIGKASLLKLLQHYLNSLHMFCRLRSMGMSKRSAVRFCRAWERLVHPFLYRGANGVRLV